MRILLTGTGGQVGGALRPLLAERGTVVAPSRAEFDLSKPETLAGRLDDLRPDLIINPAAHTAVDRAEDEHELAFLVNARAPEAIAAWAAPRRVPLVHFSTDYVFDGSGEQPWREDSPTGPLGIYGASKLAGDMAVIAAGGPALVVRTSWVYAARGNNFLRTIVRLAREREELRIVADQIGAPTSAKAIAAALARMLPLDRGGLDDLFARRGGIVNVVCSGSTSWHGFATAIIAGLTVRGVDLRTRTIMPIRTDEFPTRARRPGNSRLDLERLRADFGIDMPSWKTALSEELDAIAADLV